MDFFRVNCVVSFIFTMLYMYSNNLKYFICEVVWWSCQNNLKLLKTVANVDYMTLFDIFCCWLSDLLIDGMTLFEYTTILKVI